MTIREYAKTHGHKIVGKLTRRPEYEYDEDYMGVKHWSGVRYYTDEAGNDYYIDKNGCCIVTVDDDML